MANLKLADCRWCTNPTKSHLNKCEKCRLLTKNCTTDVVVMLGLDQHCVCFKSVILSILFSSEVGYMKKCVTVTSTLSH